MTLLLSFVLVFSSICTASAEENEGETLAQQEAADTPAPQNEADTPAQQETTTPSISLEWEGASMIDGDGSTFISLQIVNNGDTDLNLSEYTLDSPKSLKLTPYSDDTDNLTATIAPNSRKAISWKASLYEDSIEAKVAMVQLGARLRKDGKIVAERICEYPVFWIDEGRNILTYHSFQGTTADELYKYRLRMEGDANTVIGKYFLVASGGNATEIAGPDGSGETYLDPEKPGYPSFDVKDGYTLQSVELVPSDAGTIDRAANADQFHIFVVQLNKPATLKIKRLRRFQTHQRSRELLQRSRNLRR
ncbi:MAG: hypothetical protein PHQ72_05695 [Hespellia sp.]|nr:hypothetical protein [Hespellia sp.]